MKRATDKPHNKKAAVLIYVLVIMTVMASIALSMLVLARIGKLRSDVVSRDVRVNAAADYLVEKIGEEISNDLFGGEFYDYPGSEDLWLASMEPYYNGTDLDGDPNNGIVTYHSETADDTGNNFFFWRQITKLSFANFGTSSYSNVRLDPPGNIKTLPEYQELGADTVAGWPADADGDGIADARWFVLPGIKTDSGESCYAAVRIIDSSAMLNVNTSFYNNTAAGATEFEYSGDTQLCVSLESLLNSPDDDIIDFHKTRRTDDTADDWYVFNESAAARSLNPVATDDVYNLYGITDELELRHRFCINSPLVTRLEANLPFTIGANPDNQADDDYWGDMYDTYARRSRVDGGSALEDFCVGMLGGGKYPDPNAPAVKYQVEPERRHLLTAFSKSRQVTPALEPRAFTDVLSGISGVQNYTTTDLQAAIKDSFDKSGAALNEFMNEDLATLVDMKEYISRQYALNIKEYSDSDSQGDFELDADTNVLYYGFDGVDELKSFTLNCTGYGIYDHQTIVNYPTVPADTYYAIELYIEGGIGISTIDDYIVRVIRGGAVAHEMYLSDTPNMRVPANGFLMLTNGAPIQGAMIFTPAAGDIATFTDRDPLRGTLELQGGDYVVVYKKSDNGYLVTDYADVKLITPVANADTAYYQRKQGRLGDALGLILPESIGSVQDTFAAMCSLPLADNLPMSMIDVVNLTVANEPVISPAQLANVFAVCSFTDQDAFDAVTPANLLDFQTFAGAVETNKRRVLDPLIANTGVSDFAGYGRFDLTDFHYASLMDAFTVLTSFKDGALYSTAAAYDGIDNDGNRITTDNPLADGIDNNGDGSKDNIGEDASKYRESVVCGLININTAPKAVLMTLPWINEELAEAIIAYRDKTGVGVGQSSEPIFPADSRIYEGFRNISELLNVTNENTALVSYDMRKYAKDSADITADDLIDLTPDDGFTDDYEERNIIVERLSNLITTRSDVFTAWIIVREGLDGPQKRRLCIIDRSDVWQQGDKPVIYQIDVED